MFKKNISDNRQEQFKVYGHEILKKVKELIKEGNIRRIIIKDEKERTILEIPLNLAIIGTLFAPILAAVGAAAALLSSGTIIVVRKKDNFKKRTTLRKKGGRQEKKSKK